MQRMRISRTAGRRAAVALAVVGLCVSTLAGSPRGTSATDPSSAERRATPGSEVTTDPSPSDPASREPIGPDEVVLGPAAVAAIGDDLDEVAALNELTTDELTDALQDPTYGVGPGGRLFVAEFLDGEHTHDHAEAPAPAADEPVAEAAVAPLDQTFQLSSLPGSNRTIYLDFDGHALSGTVWNRDQGIPNGHTVPAFSLDTDPAFSNAELEYVQNVWAAVAEDYAPFDVNVTTQAPASATLTRSSIDDQVYGARAIVTSPRVQADFPSSCPITSNCAGLAYVGTFDAAGTGEHQFYEGAFVNAVDVSSPHALTTIISHEVGHNGGLNHAGYRDTTVDRDYYSGTGNWGPIMGTPYTRALSQWTDHSYIGANNARGPDLPILSRNGIASRADEAGATIGSAAASPWGVSTVGVVSTPTDRDVWDLGWCEGTVTVTAAPATYSTNLDASLTLLSGTEVAPVVLDADDPPSGQTGGGAGLRATGVSARVEHTADSTQYYALVEGSSTGPDGGYGNLGPYTLTAVCTGVTVDPEPPTEPPEPDPPSFVDVPAGSTFSTQIEWLAARGVSTGYDNGNGTRRFAPSDPVLREQMAAFLARYAEATLSSVAAPFTDVAPNHVFGPHIRWLAGTGVTTGYANGDGTFSFRPGQPVLREQMAAFLYRLAGSPTYTPTSACGFADVPSTHVFRTAICWLADRGISTGYEEVDGTTTFRPAQPVLREQMAAFLYRYDRAGLPVP